MRPRLLFPTLALALLAVPAHAVLPRLRPDQPVMPLTYGGVLRPIGAACVAGDGTDFLVFSYTKGFIAGTRMSSSGAALAPSIRIAELTSIATSSCAAVWTGSQYVIAYNTHEGVMARRISREGHLLDAQPRNVATLGSVAMAWNGSSILLVSGGLRYRLLDRDGVPMIAEQQLTGGINSSPVVASNGEGFFVAGIVGLGVSAVRGKTISATGLQGVLLTLPFSGGGSPISVGLASDGHDYLAGIGTTKGTSAVLVRADASTGPAVPLDDSVGFTMHVVWNGSEYAAVWERIIFEGPHDIAGMRVAASGTPLDVQAVTIQPNGERIFAAGSNGVDAIVIAEDQDDSRASAAIFRSLATIGAEPASRRLAAILNVPRDQSAPAIATNGVYSLVVWRESTDLTTGGAVFGALVHPSGAIERVIEIGSDSFEDWFEDSRPAVASNGRDFLVFWESQSKDVLARRVGVDRNLLDPAPIQLGRVARGTKIAAAWSGVAYIGVWTSENNVLAAAVSPDGVVVSAPAAINGPGGFAERPAIACNSGCTAAWEAFSALGIQGGIFSIALATNGAPSGSQTTIVNEPSTISPAVVRHAGVSGWILFSHQSRLYAARSTVVSLFEPSGIFYQSTGGGALVVATQHDTVYWTDSASGPPSRLFFARLAPDGTKDGTVEVDVVSPNALISAAQRLFVIYTEVHPDLGGDRLMLRTLATPDATPVVPRRRGVR